MPGWLWFLLQFLVIGGLFAYIIISSKKAMAEGKTTWFMKTWKKDSVKSVASRNMTFNLTCCYFTQFEPHDYTDNS